MKRLFLFVFVLNFVFSGWAEVLPKEHPKTSSEAELFYNEAKVLVNSSKGNLAEAVRKISSAVALEPGNEKYRHAELTTIARFIAQENWNERLPGIRLLLKKAIKFKKDFPKTRKMALRLTVMYGVVNNDFSKITPDQLQELEDIFVQIRALRIADLKKKYPYDLSDGIGSLNELRNYSKIILLYSRDYYFYDYSLWFQKRYQVDLEFITHVGLYASKHPGDIPVINRIIKNNGLNEVCGFWGMKGEHFYKDDDIIGFLEDDTEEFIEVGVKSPVPEIRKIALSMKFMHDTVKEPRNQKNTIKNIDLFLAEIHESCPGVLAPRGKAAKDGLTSAERMSRASQFVRWWGNSWYLFGNRIELFMQKHSIMGRWELAENKFKSCDVAWLRKNPDTVQFFNYDRLCNNEVANAYCAIPQKIFDSDLCAGKPDAIEKLLLFKELNSSFDITQKTYAELFKHKKSLYLAAAARNGGETALLLREWTPDARELIGLLSVDGKASELIETPVCVNNFSGREGVSCNHVEPIFANSEYFVIAEKAPGRLALYSRTSREWSFIENMYNEPVSSVVINNGRIYLLCSGNYSNELFCSLRSCKLDGTDRKVHFSTARNITENDLDKLKIINTGCLRVLNNNALLFFTSRYNDFRIYLYKIRENQFDCLCQLPYAGHDSDYLWSQEDQWYFCTKHPERIYQIDIDKKSITWIFSQNSKVLSCDKKLNLPVMINGGMQLSGPWLVKNNLLWCGNYAPAVVDLNDPEHSPLLMLPGCGYLFDYNKDSVLFLGVKRFFIVKPTRSALSADKKTSFLFFW